MEAPYDTDSARYAIAKNFSAGIRTDATKMTMATPHAP